MPEKDEERRTYLIVHIDGTRRKITIPANWKVTFGPAVKGGNYAPGSGPRPVMPMALRFYEHDTMQRAIFTDVQNFRDLSIPVEVEKVSHQEKDGFTEVDGVRKRTSFQVQTKEWVNDLDETSEEEKRQLIEAEQVTYEGDILTTGKTGF